ncbi:MAG TPA: peptidoglycan editing factor PgeF [Acidobacteriaceae bacterium]|nr:peptidoglycan editing factor PgeF [Acidobacteriaceae bacterium]
MVLQVPEWNSFPWLLHGFSTRRGGVSTIYGEAGCGELNLGFTPEDSRENVLENRRIFSQAVAGAGKGSAGRQKPEIALLRQIHSGVIHRVAANRDEQAAGQPQRGDGWISDRPGTWIGILTADCVPILVADTRLRVVAAFHAGWRGTLGRIAERGVGRMRAEFGCRPEDLTAAIGPGIGPCCYSVGEEVRMEFGSQFSYAEDLFQEVFDLDPIKQKYPMLFLTARAPGHSNLGPSTHLNLPEANRRQLQDAGIRWDRIYPAGSCTACNGSQFFSHRAQHGFTGRMMSVIGLTR